MASLMDEVRQYTEPLEKDFKKDRNNQAFDFMTQAPVNTAVDLYGNTPSRTSKEDIHLFLAGLGLTPGVGVPADIADSLLYLSEGEYGNAALSAISALPIVGLFSGIKKVGKGLKGAMKQQTKMVEGSQDVLRRFGKDPTDAKLVGETTDAITEGAVNLSKAGDQFEKLRDIVGHDEAFDVMAYYDSISPRAVKAAKDLVEMGYSEIEMFGKEAVESMGKSIARGKKVIEGNVHVSDMLLHDDLFKY